MARQYGLIRRSTPIDAMMARFAERSGAVVVFGGTGLLGHQLVSDLRAAGRPLTVVSRRGHAGCDASMDAATATEAEIGSLLSTERLRPSLVVNAIGVTRQAHAGARDASEMIEVNARWPKRVAAATANMRVPLIHISTDAVFPALAGEVDENARPMPEDPYGRAKLAGEPECEWALSLRCSFVGPGRNGQRGLWSWLVGQPEGAEVAGFTDQQWTGITSRQLSKLIERMIDPEIFTALRAEGPTHHLCPNPTVTKFELVATLAHVLRPDIEVRPLASGRPVTRRLATIRSASSLIADDGFSSWEKLIRAAAGTP